MSPSKAVKCEVVARDAVDGTRAVELRLVAGNDRPAVVLAVEVEVRDLELELRLAGRNSCALLVPDHDNVLSGSFSSFSLSRCGGVGSGGRQTKEGRDEARAFVGGSRCRRRRRF